jgi:hypothetical protein
MFGCLSLAAGRGSQLRRNDVVEVRTPAEILATLDEDGCREGTPFMPEMLRSLGRVFTVTARVERACDTINQTGARRMRDTVILDDLRCDGFSHGGCQAGCRLYWKEAWLRPLSAPRAADPSDPRQIGAYVELERLVLSNTGVAGAETDTYRCQATEFLRASEPIAFWDPRSFWREIRCGNVSPGRFLRVMAGAVLEEIGLRVGVRSEKPFRRGGNASSTAPKACLNPGRLVQIRPKAEIRQTLTEEGKTRGLWFDREMLPYCGHTHTVERKVDRFIDERTGRMVELKSDCYILDGVVCSGDRSYGRWFCPRAIYPWWRECWLNPVDHSVEEGSCLRTPVADQARTPSVAAVPLHARKP